MAEEPTFAGVMMQVLESAASDIHAVEFGRVHSWDRALQVADIEPLTRDRSGATRPVVTGVPVVFPGAYWDLQTGDAGVLLCGDVSLRRWWRTGQIGAEPEGIQSHALANAVFVPGLVARAGARALDAGALVLARPAAGGTVRLGTAGATKAVVHEDLLSDLSDLITALASWGSTAHANWAAAAAAFTLTVTPTLNALAAGIIAQSYESPSVMVED